MICETSLSIYSASVIFRNGTCQEYKTQGIEVKMLQKCSSDESDLLMENFTYYYFPTS